MSAAWCGRRSWSSSCTRSRIANPTSAPPTRHASRSRSTRWFASRPRPASTSSATGNSARAATGPSTSTGVTTRPLTAEEAKDPMAAAGGGQDRVAFPEFYAEYDRVSGLGKRLGSRFVVDGALSYSDAAVKRDIANLKAAVAKVKVQGAF